jgi:KUP system potassium uptake protein
MFIDSVLIAVVLLTLWKWNRVLAYSLLAIFFIVDIAYFSANLTKVPDGGWFPLLVGLVAFTLLTTWAKGRKLMIERMNEASMPIDIFIRSASTSAVRVQGTAVFMTTAADGIPHALLHNLKHNKVLHDRIILLTIRIQDVPFVEEGCQYELSDLGNGFFRLIIRYGFMQEIDVPAALQRLEGCGGLFRMMDTSFFLARQTLITSSRPGMAVWRESCSHGCCAMRSAMEFFKLPTNRVVELGSQVEI